MGRRTIKLRQCIYCFGKDVEDSNLSFNTEHVLPHCVSRRTNNLTIHCAVCTPCNGSFSGTLDQMIAEIALRGTVSIMYGINEIPFAGNKKLNKLNYVFPLNSPGHHFLHGARIRLEYTGEHFDVGLIPQIAFERHDGSWCHMTNRNLRRIPYIYDEEKYTGKAVLIKEDAETRKAIQYLEQRGMLPQLLSCRLEEAAIHHLVQSSLVDYLKRAIAKIAFNYFAWLLLPTRPEILLSPAFDQIRRYVRYGEQQSPEIVQVQADLSAARLPLFPNHYSALLKIQSDNDGIYGEVSLFDLFTWSVRIAGGGTVDSMLNLPSEHVWRLRQRLNPPLKFRPALCDSI